MKKRRRKTSRAPVMAAGGIVMQGGARPLVAVVQRRKDDCWVLPKGKLKPRENPIAAAKREAVEETGYEVSVHEFLGAISYEVGGKPKIVQFWRMRTTDGPARELMRDIKAVEWLPLQSAIARLTQPLERVFLGHIGSRAVALSRPATRRRRAARGRKTARSRRRTGKQRHLRRVAGRREAVASRRSSADRRRSLIMQKGKARIVTRKTAARSRPAPTAAAAQMTQTVALQKAERLIHRRSGANMMQRFLNRLRRAPSASQN